jgi:hypothetical protein
MRQGQAYISQKYGVVSSMAVAVTDNLAILFGTLTPFPPALAVFGAKYAIEFDESLHLGLGVETFIFPLYGEFLGTVGFANRTFGNLDNNLTLAAGVLTSDLLDIDVGIPIMLGAQLRISNKLSIVSENWLILDVNEGQGPIALNALTMRFLGQRNDDASLDESFRTERGFPRKTWDLGFAVLTDTQTGEFIGPLPWLDWSWHFGPLGD